jgi:hypothetical protein
MPLIRRRSGTTGADWADASWRVSVARPTRDHSLRIGTGRCAPICSGSLSCFFEVSHIGHGGVSCRGGDGRAYSLRRHHLSPRTGVVRRKRTDGPSSPWPQSAASGQFRSHPDDSLRSRSSLEQRPRHLVRAVVEYQAGLQSRPLRDAWDRGTNGSGTRRITAHGATRSLQMKCSKYVQNAGRTQTSNTTPNPSRRD